MLKKAFILTAFLTALGTLLYGQPPPPGTLVLSPTTFPDGLYGSAYVNQSITVTGGMAPYTFSVSGGNLPPGMVLSTDGVLSGTPTAAGSFPFTVTALDNGGPGPGQASGSQDYTLVIDPAALMISAANATMSYGGTMPTLTASFIGFVNGDNPASLTKQPSITTTAAATSPAGPYPITVAGAVDPNYAITYQPATFTITPVALTITANNATMNYGGTFPVLGVSYNGFVNGDNASSLSTGPSITTTATTTSPAGPYSISITGAADPNYTIIYQPATFTITPVALTITANNATMTYGGSVPALGVAYSGFVNGDNASSLSTGPSVTTTATATSAAGPYPVTASGAVDPNYAITYQPGTLTVGKAALTVTADNKAMALGGPLPALTVSYTGFLNADNASSLTTQPVATTTATTASPAGTYPITPHGAVSTNYNFTYVGGSLAVAQAVLTITANPASSIYGAPLVPKASLTVSYSGFVNGDGPGSLTTLPSVTNSASANSPAGNYTLSASGAVDANYLIQYVNGAYTIHPAPLGITAVNQTMNYGGAVPALTVSYSGFVNGDKSTNLTSPPITTTTATSSSAAGSYPITVSGAVDPNYTITYNPGTLTINPVLLQVTANAQTKKFGAPDPAFTYTASGFLNGDNTSIFSGNLSRAAGENVGTYPITVGSLSAGGNYNIHFTGSLLTITVASQEITWTQGLTVGCNSTTQVQLNATASSNLAVTYSVSDKNIATVSGNVLTLLRPGTTVVTATQAGNANFTAARAVADTVFYQAASLITQHWHDAIFFDNSSGDYVAWQWYKNDSLVAGATDAYYSETPTLNGQYFVIATNKDGRQIQSCTLAITGSSAIPGGIKVYPNPANTGSQVTVTINYAVAALQNAVLQVVDLTGKVRQQITNVQPTMQVTMPTDNGLYIITLLLSGGAKASTNVLVVN
jgi:hypothetical protein